MSSEFAVGVDIGGTKIAFALIDSEGNVLAEHRLPTLPNEGVQAVIGRIVEGVHALEKQASGEVIGVGVGCPGHIDNGVVRTAVNLGWTNIPLLDELSNRFPIPVFVGNDAASVAIGEMWCGAARGHRNFVYAAIGTGLGGSAVVNGEVVTGMHGFAMEIGHFPLVPNGRLCNCGRLGCTETYVSGLGLLAGVREHRAQYPQTTLSQEPSTAEILTAARSRDPLAAAVMHEAREKLCYTLAWCAGMFNPSLIIIGGGLAQAARDFLSSEVITDGIRSLMMYPIHEGLQVVPAQITATATGAGCLVWAHRA
ncbi:MAG: ROK family protein [Anaerolineae bacterium]